MSIEHHKLFKFSNKMSLSVLEIKNSLKVHSIRTTYINNAYRMSLKGNHDLHGFQLYLIFLTVLLVSFLVFTLRFGTHRVKHKSHITP